MVASGTQRYDTNMSYEIHIICTYIRGQSPRTPLPHAPVNFVGSRGDEIRCTTKAGLLLLIDGGDDWPHTAEQLKMLW